MQAEQTRIESELTQAERLVKAASHEAADVLDALDDALTIVGRCHEIYLEASPMLRRLMNQVIFERLLIRSDNIEGEQQPVFAHITRLGRGCQASAKPQRPRNGQGPRLYGGLGSNVETMVRMRGLEPPRPYGHGDLNAARLPFRHIRVSGDATISHRGRSKNLSAVRHGRGGCAALFTRCTRWRRSAALRPPYRSALSWLGIESMWIAAPGSID